MSVESSLLHPYEFVRESDTDYTFITDEGMVYRAYFIDYSDQFPALEHIKSEDIVKYDTSLDTGDYMLYVSLFLHSANPNYRQIVYSFYNLVSNNMCPE